jgi:hypothetical protein
MHRTDDFKVLNSEARQRLRALRERSERDRYEADCSKQLSRAILSYEQEDRSIQIRTLDVMRDEIKSLRELERLWNQK